MAAVSMPAWKRTSVLTVPDDGQAGLHIEHASHLPRANFRELAIARIVDDFQQHGSPVLYDDVNWIPADRLHAREVSLVPEFLQFSECTTRGVPRQESSV